MKVDGGHLSLADVVADTTLCVSVWWQTLNSSLGSKSTVNGSYSASLLTLTWHMAHHIVSLSLLVLVLVLVLVPVWVYSCR
jgi:hypothetical protein